MTTEQAAGTFRAVDTIRPFSIKTYDVGSDFRAWLFYETRTDAFLATDRDNEWRDGGRRGRSCVRRVHVRLLLQASQPIRY